MHARVLGEGEKGVIAPGAGHARPRSGKAQRGRMMMGATVTDRIAIFVDFDPSGALAVRFSFRPQRTCLDSSTFETGSCRKKEARYCHQTQYSTVRLQLDIDQCSWPDKRPGPIVGRDA